MTAISLAATGQASEAPTIASTSLCGDSYLLALVPDHISALSWQSRSKLSRASEKYRNLPQLWDDPEKLATNQADIVLFGSGEGALAQGMDKQNLTLIWGEDFDSVMKNADMITEKLGVGNVLRAELEKRLSALKIRADQREIKPKVLYLARSGGSAGTGTLVDAAIRAAGGENIITQHGWQTPDPEAILGFSPDLIITSYFTNGYESVNAALLRHSVVRRHVAKFPQVDIDGGLWPCAGPDLIVAAELIADGLDTLP